MAALAGPFLAYLTLQSIFGASLSHARVAAGLLLHWLNLAIVIAIVVALERQPLTSIGVRRVPWWVPLLGIVAGIACTVTSSLLVRALHLSTDQAYAGFLQSQGLILRILVVVTAGVFEETLYRGYALERLATILRSRWLAAAVTLVLFTLMHRPAVGWNHLVPIAIMGALLTLLYLWQRNLVLNIIAHTTVDAIGLIVAPLLVH